MLNDWLVNDPSAAGRLDGDRCGVAPSASRSIAAATVTTPVLAVDREPPVGVVWSGCR